MYPMLTVEENLTFSARIRLPADFTHGQHLHHVEQAIQVGPERMQLPVCGCARVWGATGMAGVAGAALPTSVEPTAKVGTEFSRANAVPEGGL